MTAEAAVRGGPSASEPVWRWAHGLRRFNLIVVAIAAVQAAWLGGLTATGWFYQDDFTFTAQASSRSLGWNYLSLPVNEHLTPGLRLQFWLFRHIMPLNYPVTIAYRMALQILCTILLARLLVALFGQRQFVLWAVASYAFSPLIVPGFMWLASATNLLPAQAFAILAVHSHILFVREQRLKYATYCGLSLIALALFWEKSATIALILPILSIGFLIDGHGRERLRSYLGQWRGLLLEYLPLAAFVLVFAAGGYGRSAVSGAPSFTRVVYLTGDAWTHTFAPTLMGGPWRWYSVPSVYVSAADPSLAVVIIAQATFVIIVLAGVRRMGPRSLLAWLIPWISMATGVILVSEGRYKELGGLLTRIYSYSYDVALPLLLGVCLALFPPLEAQVGSREITRLDSSFTRRVSATLAVVTIASGMISTLAFVNKWSKNPAEEYFTTLRRSLRAMPPGSSIYDTAVSLRVLPFFNPVRNLSDVLPLAGLHPTYNAPDQDPLFVDDSGHVVQSSFFPASVAIPLTHNKFCNTLIRGTRATELHLRRAPGKNDWFLRLEYFRQNYAAIDVRVRDRTGRVVRPITRTDVAFGAQVGVITLRLPTMDPASIILTPQTADANVCLTSTEVGSPVPARP